MQAQPHLLRVHELRRCVKALTGNKRWTRRCRQLRDQIVAYLRAAWADAAGRTSSQASLIIQ